jgi:hypothetical protein
MLNEIKTKQASKGEDTEMVDVDKEKEDKDKEKEKEKVGEEVEVEEAPKIPPPPPPPPSQLVQRLDSAKAAETLSFFQNAGEETYPSLLYPFSTFLIFHFLLFISPLA